ncbi:PRC1-like protein [Mya arenaria]|uniref:PRC1-like protein n=1 Tax=Mya arenaria TaxID=6604 RepID=A0ABY7FJX2_MYAAR|nr:PRC1-like protein [Mya arenaria]
MESGNQQLLTSIQSALGKLYQIWDRIGIGKANQDERSTTVLKHVQGLLDDMVDEEEVLEKQIETRVSDLTEELAQLSKELQVSDFKPPTGLSILHKEKELRTKANSLRAEKKERQKILAKLRADDQALCDVLCMTPYYIPSGSTPTGEQLKELETHIHKLSMEKTRRYSTFIDRKKHISDLMLEMERSPETAFEQEVVVEDESRFVLSCDNMSALEALLSELQVEVKRCEAQKLANIQKFVDGIRHELETWWNKCYYSAKQRAEFKHFSDSDYTEYLLTVHEREVATVKEYYENNKGILQLVEQREALFHKMIEFEKRANDPNRFFSDRGGKLLLEEKERKSLMKQLPKVEQEVKDKILVWEKEHGRIFSVNGLPFITYIEKTWKDHEEQKQREKDEKQKAKTKQMNEEMLFGSKPSTPVKRRFQPTNTPTKTPKQRKVNDTTKTPGSTSRLQQSTVYHSPYRKMGTNTGPHSNRMASTSKLAPGSRNRRRSNRLARKVLGDRNDGTNESHVFSQTTISSVEPGGNGTLASTGSYQEFAGGLKPTVRPFCRSSLAPQGQSPIKSMDHHRL